MEDLHPYNLLARYLANELSTEQAREFEAWRSASPENQQLLHELEKLWHATPSAQASAAPDIDQAWRRLSQRLQLQTRGASVLPLKTVVAQQPSRMRWPARRAWLAAAAVLLIGISLYVLAELPQGSALHVAITHNSQQLEITLSDGSVVRLNSGSKLQYPKTFSDSLRQVLLDGEAFFQVTPAARAFVVVTSNAVTRVLGTAFNVRARSEHTRVIVRKGSVRLQAAHGEAHTGVVIHAGEMSECEPGQNPGPAVAANVEHLLGWLAGKLVFVQTPLSEIAAELARFYDVSVQLTDSSLANKSVTGTFQNQTLPSVLSSLCLTLDLQYVKTKGRYLIMRKSAAQRP